MKTTVIVSSVNRRDAMLRLCAGLIAQTQRPDELILIEAGHLNWTAEDVPPELRAGFRPIMAPKLSLAAARAMGQRAATGEVLFFFDDDIIIPPDYIATALNYFAAHPAMMAVGGIYTDTVMASRAGKSLWLGRMLGIYADGSANRLLPSGWADYVRGKATTSETAAEWLFGCNFAVRASAFPRARFEEEMAAWSFLEDVFFGLHLRDAWGDCIRILPALKVIHDPPTSGGRISPITLRMRILYRYILWRDHVCKGRGRGILRFALGLVANALLMFKQERKFWTIADHGRALLFILHQPRMNWEQAHDFIFARH